jgi:hypothetical protein
MALLCGSKRAGLGNPPGECFLRIISCYEGSALETGPRARGSSRNVGDIGGASPSAVLNSTSCSADVGPVTYNGGGRYA